MITDRQQELIKKFQRQGSTRGFSKAEHAVMRRIRKELATTLIDFYAASIPDTLKLYISLNGDFEPKGNRSRVTKQMIEKKIGAKQ